MMRKTILALAFCASASTASAQPTAHHAGQCFRDADYQGFKPINDHAFNIRVGVGDYYRIELEGVCPEILDPSASLITVVRGSDWICDPLDWDLRVRSSPGLPAVPCIVKSQTKLTPEQAAAIPQQERP